MDAGSQRSGPNVLVTGASGFIGHHLCDGLVRDGWDVAGLTRRTGVALPAGVRIVSADLADPATADRVIVGFDAVCHLAAYIPPDLSDPGAAAACLEQNALVALRVAEAAARRSARLVFFSSGQVYRPSPEPVAEDAPTYPSGHAAYYLASKLAGELFVEHARAVRGLDAVTLRVGSCYGFGMPAHSVVARFMSSACAGLPLEVRDGGTARYDFVAVSDVVSLTMAALRGGERGVFNAGSGRAASVLELARVLEAVFVDRPLDVRVQPPSGACSPGFSPLAIGKASAALGYRPCDLLEGLREYRRQLEAPPW